jgi:FlaA1/EpsC-like NDP-sugar epimerase
VRIHGLPVLGRREDIPRLVRDCAAQQVVIAMPRAPGAVIRQVRAICEKAGVAVRTIPGLYEILSGRVKVSQIRDVTIADLLRREPVVIDQAEVGAYLRDATVLVTGAGGSIGSELCRQIAGHDPRQLILLGHGEHSIFTIQRELRRTFPDLALNSVIADVRDEARLNWVMDAYRPTVVFHAAAHKHVPLMETNVMEAITNNVLGTQRLIQAAERCEVHRFVLISTDKAVNPVSVMGACKRIGEMLVQEAARRNGSIFVGVRFGNVLGSRGSVIEVFQRQIAAGGPLTVTHPEMRRYFMTIPEAVQLVLQAAALGQGGEIFVLDMGEPVRIVDLARDLIELSGLTPERDVEISFCGTRPGEKMCEELFSQEEDWTPTRHPKILVVRGAPAIEGQKLQQAVHELEQLAEGMREEAIWDKLQELVPEYRPAISYKPPERVRENVVAGAR